MEKEELLQLLLTKLNNRDLLLENLRTLEYFHFSKECLVSLRNLKREKVLTVVEFRNKQKLLAHKVLPSLLKSKEDLTAGAPKKHLTNLDRN